ncbi:MAG: hypothetical protein DME67_07360, partial [Verrucomicrobia bacterium]
MKHKLFRGLGAILFKEFIVVARDPLTLFFFFFPPLIEMIAFGYALDNDVKHMAMLVFNEDRTVESRQLIDRFVNTETFRVVGEVQSLEQLKSEMRKGRAYAALDIPPNFTRELLAGHSAQVQLLVDGSNSTTALQALQTGLGVALTQSMESLLRETGRKGMPIDVRPQMLYNPAMRAPNFFVPGVIGVVLQIGTTVAGAMALVRAIAGEPLKPRGPDARKAGSVFVYRHGNGGGFVHHYAVCVFRSNRGQCLRDDVFHARLCVCITEPGFARWDQGRKPNAGAPNVDGVPVTKRLLFRIHFPTGNHAVDFLRARRALSHDIFHRTHARDHFARRDAPGILAEPCCPDGDVDLAVQFLRVAISEKNCVSAQVRSSCVAITSFQRSAHC